VGASSRHWRSVARDYWQSLHKRDQLRLPLSTAASCLPALREAFTYCLPNHVDNWSVSYLIDAFRDGCHTGSGYFSTVSVSEFSAHCKGYRALTKGDRGPENRVQFKPSEGISLTAVITSNLGNIPLLSRGKVRDLYAIGDALLLVATDRISAFDHVLATGIPGKGKILTQISLFWFDLLSDIVPNHVITANANEFPAELQPFREQLEGRAMLVKRAKMFPVECVARGYLAGSGWKDYQRSGAVCGIALPTGLLDGSRLPDPVFTPATKSQDGAHDENISFGEIEARIGADEAAELRRLTLEIYGRASAHAESRGLILADTKFEFGTVGGKIILADEVLTPDSSRFWDAGGWKPGGAQPSFDKQFVRDYLEAIRWNKQAPPPGLPPDVAERTRDKYLEAFHRLTGRKLT
jgi:phosphoribosylaminoimidazole-succinocarboxamide synthase